MKNKIENLVEASVIQEISDGSYEDRMTSICIGLDENSDLFGGSVGVIATFPSKVIVLNESGMFYSAGYHMDKHNHVSFDDIEELSVPVITEDDLKRKPVLDFFEGRDLGEAMAKNLKGSFAKEIKSPIEKVTESLEALFESGKIWRGYVDANRVALTRIAFDGKFGSPKIETRPCFEEIFSADEDSLEEHREDVGLALEKIQGRLSRLFTVTVESIEEYKNAIDDSKQEAHQPEVNFNEFNTDYLNYLNSVGGFVSESISKNSSECVLCGALVHDEIAKRITDLELGSRLIRKVSFEYSR